MPSTEVESNHGHESLDRVIYFGHWKERFGVGHETMHRYFVISYLINLPLRCICYG